MYKSYLCLFIYNIRKQLINEFLPSNVIIKYDCHNKTEALNASPAEDFYLKIKFFLS